MFSTIEKMNIAEKIQELLRDMSHPQLPKKGNIHFHLHINGIDPHAFCDINNVTIRCPPTSVSLKKKVKPARGPINVPFSSKTYAEVMEENL